MAVDDRRVLVDAAGCDHERDRASASGPIDRYHLSRIHTIELQQDLLDFGRADEEAAEA